MTPYVFEVLKDGAVIYMRSVVLPHIRHAWPEIARLAKRFGGPGHKIRVKDEDGGIVILTGVGAVWHPTSARGGWRKTRSEPARRVALQ